MTYDPLTRAGWATVLEDWHQARYTRFWRFW